MKRGVVYILVFLLALQSCTIYRNTVTPLPLAVDKGKVQLFDEDYGPVFKNIILSDSSYYGIKRNGERVLLTDEQVKLGVHLKNKPASTTLSIAIPVVGVFLFIWLSASSMSFM